MILSLFGFVGFSSGHVVLSCLALCFRVFTVLFSVMITSRVCVCLFHFALTLCVRD